MNCNEFQSTLNEVEREALTDARARAGTEAHAAECERCAALLSDARALTEGLRALAAETATAAAPPRVEANLLAAFRAQKAARHAPVTEVAEVATAATEKAAPAAVVPFQSKRWSWSKTFGAAGMAAAAAVALVVLVPQMFSGPRPNGATYQADSRQASRPNAQQPAQEKIIVSPDVANDVRDEIDERDADRELAPTVPAVAAHAPRASRGATMTGVRYNVGGARNNAARPADASPAAASERAEITTEFIPLAQGGGFLAGEGGHVVRVELPRTALARFGLPVNAELPEGRVKADVLIGEDGMARAIRFVR